MQSEALTLYDRSVQHGAKVEKIDLKEAAFGFFVVVVVAGSSLLLRCPVFGFTQKLEDPHKLDPTSPMSQTAANAKSCKNRQPGAAFNGHIVNTSILPFCPWEVNST